MTRYWGWRLACLASLCLLLSLVGLQVTIPHENNFERHAATSPRELRGLSRDEILQLTNRVLIQSRAGPAHPRECLPVPEVFLYAEDLHPGSPPWFEDRGPPDRYRAPGRAARLPVMLAALNGGVNYASTLHFGPVDRPN